MQLFLRPEEGGMLRAILARYLPDLRMEVAGTEDYETRQELHRYEAALQDIIARLDQQQASPIAAEAVPGHRHPHPFVQRPGD